jgi:hypothetical protein
MEDEGLFCYPPSFASKLDHIATIRDKADLGFLNRLHEAGDLFVGRRMKYQLDLHDANSLSL